MYGTVLNYSTRDSLPGSHINIQEFSPGDKSVTTLTNVRGQFEYYLERNKVYKVSFSTKGRVAKSVELNLQNAPDSLWDDGISMNINMTLFRKIPGVDFSFPQAPIGKCKYDPAFKQLTWDLVYTEVIRGKMKGLLEDYELGQKKK